MKPIWIILFLLPVIQHSQAWKKSWKRPVCDPVKCEPNCREVSSPRGCPTCLCEKVPECAVPHCGPGCKIQTEFKGPCPGCDCEDDIIKGIPEAEKLVCDPVKCVGNCREVQDPTGCPKCVCDPLCSPPKCAPGCVIETVFDGPCPGCKCGGIGIGDDVKFDLKKPMCSPPLCPPGCVIETEFSGPCPGCKCGMGGKVIPELPKIICDPVKCAPECNEVMDPTGCPKCICPLCTPPKCDPGCEVEIEFEGPCPGCKCELKKEIELKIECPPEMACGKGCKIEIDDKGCKKCICEPECSIPHCQEGCILKTPRRRCPFCHCPKRWSFKKD